MNVKGIRRKNQVVNIFEQQKMIAKAENSVSPHFRLVTQGKALKVQKIGPCS